MLECRLAALSQPGPDDIGNDFPRLWGFSTPRAETSSLNEVFRPRSRFTGEDRFWLLPMQMVFRNEVRHNFILSAGAAAAGTIRSDGVFGAPRYRTSCARRRPASINHCRGSAMAASLLPARSVSETVRTSTSDFTAPATTTTGTEASEHI
ncbi:hypothetical protein A3L23_03467 [Rhodococcoides fascians D188]|nr:hypothetical protein A3L23_03467 [Rhodococcus fascians D188]